MHGGAHIRSVPLREFSFYAGSFGPSNPLRGYGHPMGTHVGTPMGHPLLKNKIFLHQGTQ